MLCFVSTNPAGLSSSLLSAHLNVTLFGAETVTGEAGTPVCPSRVSRFSSSSRSARKEHEEGGDWTAVALQMEKWKPNELSRHSSQKR